MTESTPDAARTAKAVELARKILAVERAEGLRIAAVDDGSVDVEIVLEAHFLVWITNIAAFVKPGVSVRRAARQYLDACLEDFGDMAEVMAAFTHLQPEGKPN